MSLFQFLSISEYDIKIYFYLRLIDREEHGNRYQMKYNLRYGVQIMQKQFSYLTKCVLILYRILI